jgi:hypothetical protein
MKQAYQRRHARQSRPPNLRATPSPDQPGTLRQQLEVIDLYLSNPFRRIDRDAAWQLARRLVLQHARAAV